MALLKTLKITKPRCLADGVRLKPDLAGLHRPPYSSGRKCAVKRICNFVHLSLYLGC